ncbi:MAG: type II toxin-antitoxin system PemK/MazF family toxin [Lachnospiraceae bacterium]|nr:type II toxin-antitoxin system PemK/MazF family toxin [Lachnospiraceae bacterium]
MDIRRGDIFYIYKQAYTGSEQESGRPAIVVSNNIGNEHAPIVSVVYMTTQEKNNQPTHAKVNCNKRECTVLCEQVATVSKSKIGSYITSCTEEEMDEVDAALACALGLDFDIVYAEDEKISRRI